MSELITRKEAINQGQKRYYNGIPCPQGHIAEHRIDGSCVECDRIRSRNYYTKHFEKIQKQERKYRKANPDKRREQKLKRKYGITLSEFNIMLTEQGGRCAICRTDDSGVRDWNVDHDHETGKVRGLLCTTCNHLLGNAKDSPTLLELAIVYLKN